jgi:hypothetical protein
LAPYAGKRRAAAGASRWHGDRGAHRATPHTAEQAIARPRLRGSDLITRMTDAAALATSDDEQNLWRLAARMIMPNLEYAVSLDGTPAYALTRYVPRPGVGLATIAVLDLDRVQRKRIEITYDD